MKLDISNDAHNWYVNELELEKGDSLRIYGKYGGATNVHVGLSTGITVTAPTKPAYSVEKDGITYYIEETDAWFFDDYVLKIELEHDEPTYVYQ
ncbi:hypothetical protein CBF34_02905 [Vagococcus penaei]|uniref:Uncharacterized protein n=1 Tax=Vagococcus penaei TaxID=633807 RepID=A0A1Q2D432_9ENTE|nr:hypothetical protein [Vagococcus penaei]AQP53061.1 hypothetical protein BW732_01680 [Vagococcus penaei]RSU06075.1 hypothetical protein CBF34_02905 [Vagococcus penaei]